MRIASWPFNPLRFVSTCQVVMLVVPLKVTVAPLPAAAGLIVPEMLQVGVPLRDGRISQILRLYRSVVGAVSLIVTLVPLSGVELDWPCTQ